MKIESHKQTAPPEKEGADHLKLTTLTVTASSNFHSISKNDLPIALAVRVSAIRRRGVISHYLVSVQCPFGCKAIHTHGTGVPEISTNLGTRVSHCVNHLTDNQYQVIVPIELLAQVGESQ